MAYFILMGRRIPKQAITGFKFQGKCYFIYYISCDYNCPFHINSKLKKKYE